MQPMTQPWAQDGYQYNGPPPTNLPPGYKTQAQLYAEQQALQSSQHTSRDPAPNGSSRASSVYSPSLNGDQSPTFSNPSSLSTFPTSMGRHYPENDAASLESSSNLHKSRNTSYDLTRDPQLSAYFSSNSARGGNSIHTIGDTSPPVASGSAVPSTYEYSPSGSSQGYEGSRSSESGHYAGDPYQGERSEQIAIDSV